MAPATPTRHRDRIAAQVTPAVVAAGYDLEDLTVTQAGRRSVVRVVVDADGGVSLDDIAVVARAVSAALDEADGDGGLLGRSPYTLEVTSPGVDRPLVTPRHWRRNVGRLVRVPVRGEPLTGRITAATDAGVALDVGGTRCEAGYGELGEGRIQVEFSRSAPPADEAASDPIVIGPDPIVKGTDE